MSRFRRMQVGVAVTHGVSVDTQAAITNNAVTLYEQALANVQRFSTLTGTAEKVRFWTEAKPQIANVLAGAYADIITATLQAMAPTTRAYAATSNASNRSKTSAISLFSNGTALPSVTEFSAAMKALDLNSLKCEQLHRIFISEEKTQAMRTPLNPVWQHYESLSTYRKPNIVER